MSPFRRRLKIYLRAFVLALVLGGAWPARSQPLAKAPAGALDLPSAFSKREFQSLLQRFVDEQYRKSFSRLGEEADFDHGHLLFDAKSPQRPVAILYHTQELSPDPALDPQARNWIQWVDRGTVENAARYERKAYPTSVAWEWFQRKDLPALRQRHTILDKMLDPELLGAQVAESRQWIFSRIECGPEQDQPGADVARIVLPAGEKVCLALHQD
jgi:hypothetical protein